ncbi:hypothetical protein PMIN01_03356 [Paraphaeosphaeria minitans]|uniref:Uncharacterized protein n=1 Tax=Paraphaeosphaeria minitans TaxID=565426 RepID=A0A9P6GN05_9PLEO|nr:hypothetical protein PMIN01_03356 [Paraphaeosphaeria minitans]
MAHLSFVTSHMTALVPDTRVGVRGCKPTSSPVAVPPSGAHKQALRRPWFHPETRYLHARGGKLRASKLRGSTFRNGLQLALNPVSFERSSFPETSLALRFPPSIQGRRPLRGSGPFALEWGGYLVTITNMRNYEAFGSRQLRWAAVAHSTLMPVPTADPTQPTHGLESTENLSTRPGTTARKPPHQVDWQ